MACRGIEHKYIPFATPMAPEMEPMTLFKIFPPSQHLTEEKYDREGRGSLYFVILRPQFFDEKSWRLDISPTNQICPFKCCTRLSKMIKVKLQISSAGHLRFLKEKIILFWVW